MLLKLLRGGGYILPPGLPACANHGTGTPATINCPDLGNAPRTNHPLRIHQSTCILRVTGSL